MKISVALLVVAVCASVASATLVYQESFENGLGGYTLTSTPVTSTDQAHDGLYSLKTTSSGQRAYKSISAVTDPFTFEYWLYDNGGARGYGEVRAYSGAWASTLQQLFAIGKYSSTDLNVGSGAEAYQNTKYQARITNGIQGIVGGSWFNLNAAGSPNRSNGWHKFTITTATDYSSVSFYVDSLLSRTINLGSTGKPAAGFNFAVYGLGAGTTAETFYYDQVTLNTIPEPVTAVLLGLGGLFLRRRTVR